MRPDVPPSKHPWSYGNVWGNLLFVGNHPPARGATDFEAQCRSVLGQIGIVLRLAGSDYRYVLHTGIYLRDAKDLNKLNQIYREFFPKDFPTRSTLITAHYSDEWLITMDAVAGIPDKV